MPNWCSNEIEIYGSKEDVKKFVELVTDKFDFNRIIPMPEELEGTSSPATIVPEEEYEDRMKEIKERSERSEKSGIELGKCLTQKMSDELIDKYGFNNWYDWRLRHWGVKWSVSVEEWDASDDSIFIRFMSAWSPPDGICNKLREMFPDLQITWFYREDGNQIAGWL